MTPQEIDITLRRLHKTINNIRESHREEKEIRVKMGAELFNIIAANYTPYFIHREIYENVQSTIFGYPVERDFLDPWLLEVHVVEKVPVYRESEGEHE
jgi:hypothetical protein